MLRLYDRRRDALVYVGEHATEAFWDARWRTEEDGLRALLSNPPRSEVTWTTSRYLKPGDGPVLEGGCGRGQHVAALARAGYRCIGLDSAPRTVEAIHRVAPDLDVRLGDVRSLPFESGFFGGYWSLGVIEHFWDGYAAILSEAARVLRPGGVFFLAYPYMSPARRARVRLGGFADCEDTEPKGFYQFALPTRRVQADVEAEGFRLERRHARGGVTGLRQELPESLRGDEKQSSAFPVRLVRGVANRVLAPVFGHSILEVYRRLP